MLRRVNQNVKHKKGDEIELSFDLLDINQDDIELIVVIALQYDLIQYGILSNSLPLFPIDLAIKF